MGHDEDVTLTSVEFIREDALAYTVQSEAGKEFKLSREFVFMSYGDKGKRVFTAQRWYFEKIGLGDGV